MSTRLQTSTAAPLPRRQKLIKPFELSCGLIGSSAVGLSLFVNWAVDDRTGEVLILLLTVGLIIVLLRGLRNRAVRQLK